MLKRKRWEAMMNQSFEFLGLNENATKEQVQEAYDRKAAQYSGSLFNEDPKYAKKKLKELKIAYEEAYSLAAYTSVKAIDEDGTIEGDTAQDPLENPEEYMQKQYHKYLGSHIYGMADIPPNRSRRQRKNDSEYKSNVMLFWLGILGVIVVIGLIL